MKLTKFVVGAAMGTAGVAAWILSDPDRDVGAEGATSSLPDALGLRAQVLRERLTAALEEGQRAGTETENRMRRELDTYRQNPDRPATS